MQIFLGMIAAVIIVIGGMWFMTSDKTKKTDTIVSTITPAPTPMPIKKFEKLMIEDVQTGTGSAVKSGDTISIHYLGTLTNGTKFDSSYDRGAPFQTQIGVGRVIRGWDEGVLGMKVGGKRRLLIPAALGYGSRAMGSIPANSDLVFEVELVGIQ